MKSNSDHCIQKGYVLDLSAFEVNGKNSFTTLKLISSSKPKKHLSRGVRAPPLWTQKYCKQMQQKEGIQLTTLQICLLEQSRIKARDKWRSDTGREDVLHLCMKEKSFQIVSNRKTSPSKTGSRIFSNSYNSKHTYPMNTVRFISEHVYLGLDRIIYSREDDNLI